MSRIWDGEVGEREHVSNMILRFATSATRWVMLGEHSFLTPHVSTWRDSYGSNTSEPCLPDSLYDWDIKEEELG